jgi:hypothetical protein
MVSSPVFPRSEFVFEPDSARLSLQLIQLPFENV